MPSLHGALLSFILPLSTLLFLPAAVAIPTLSLSAFARRHGNHYTGKRDIVLAKINASSIKPGAKEAKETKELNQAKKPRHQKGQGVNATDEDSKESFDMTPFNVLPLQTNETTAQAAGLEPNNAGDTHSLLITLGVSACLTTLILICASNLRWMVPAVYSQPERVDDLQVTYLSQLRRGYSVGGEEAIELAGLDAWLLVEFYSLLRRILCTIGPVLVLVLCPLHYTLRGENRNDFLSSFDIDGVEMGSKYFWVHASMVWFVVVVSTMYMSRAHNQFIEFRIDWLVSLRSPRATTLLVENIPAQYRSDVQLKNYFTGLFGDAAVEKAYIVRRTETLRTHLATLEKVEYSKMRAEVYAVSDHPDTPEYAELEKKYQIARDMVLREQEDVNQAASVGDPKVCSSVGFVTFSSVLWRRLASREQYRTDVTEFVVQLPPDPSDVIYTDLKRDSVAHHTSEGLGGLCLLCVFLFWSPVVVFISGFTTFDEIQEHYQLFKDLKQNMPITADFLESILATAAMKLFMALLPFILFIIIKTFFTRKAGAWAQIRLMRWYYGFLLIFVVLVTIVGRSLLIFLVALALEPADIIGLMAKSLPGASHFYINYLVLDWFTTVWQHVRHGNLINYLMLRLRSMTPEAAKHLSEPESEAFCGMGSRMGHGVLIATLAILLCTCSPVIAIFSTISFMVGRMTYGYLLVYVESPKSDTGGYFWIEAQKQLFFALFLYVLLMVAILVKQAANILVPFFAAASLVFLWRAWEKFNNLGWEQLPLEKVVEISRKAERKDSRMPVLIQEYIQPECDVKTLSLGVAKRDRLMLS